MKDIVGGHQLTTGITIGDEIGSGHFGTVHRGIDHVHGNIAIKVLRRVDGEPDDEWYARGSEFVREGQALKSVECDETVRIHHVGAISDKDLYCLVMDYFPNGSLKDVYERGPAPLRFVADVVHCVSVGLTKIHAKRMLHRDIKPSNILMESSTRFRIADFGLATETGRHGYGSAAGYAPYTAPEVREGKGSSVRSDIWAFGLTVYQLLNGKEFVQEGNKPLWRVSIIDDAAQHLEWLPHIPQEWRRFVEQMMAHDKDKRFPNAERVSHKLNRLKPDLGWAVDFTPARVVWTRNVKRGKNMWVEKVEWSRSRTGVNTWEATFTSPAGKTTSFRGSQKDLSYDEAVTELEEYFEPPPPPKEES